MNTENNETGVDNMPTREQIKQHIDVEHKFREAILEACIMRLSAKSCVALWPISHSFRDHDFDGIKFDVDIKITIKK
jgi:hypothetical protein